MKKINDGLGQVHAGYKAIWKEMQQEETSNIQLGLEGKSHKEALQTLQNMAVGACVLVALVVSIMAFLERGPRKDDRIQESAGSPVDSRLARNDREMELVKGILSGIVETLSKMERKSVDVDLGMRPMAGAKRCRVTAALANLRSAPRKDAPSVAQIPKETVLLITDTVDGWTKVQSPLGTEAWINDSLIERLAGQES